MIAAQSIIHTAEQDTSPLATAHALPMSSTSNLDGWDSWVRASLYLSDFLKDLKWKVDKQARSVTLSLAGKAFYSVQRPDIDLFVSQLAKLRDYQDQRADRSAEILSQMGFPIDYFASILGLNAARNRFTFELILITQVIASHVAMVVKHHLACRRPDRLGATVMPMIPTPGHATFPSAHATEAFAVATLLEGLLGTDVAAKHYPSVIRLKKLVFKQAERIAVNRTVAGMHYPIDTWAGAALGEAVGQIILAKCVKGSATLPRHYDATDVDFSVSNFKWMLWQDKAPAGAAPNVCGLARGDKTIPVAASDLFGWLWKKSQGEFSLG